MSLSKLTNQITDPPHLPDAFSDRLASLERNDAQLAEQVSGLASQLTQVRADIRVIADAVNSSRSTNWQTIFAGLALMVSIGTLALYPIIQRTDLLSETDRDLVSRQRELDKQVAVLTYANSLGSRFTREDYQLHVQPEVTWLRDQVKQLREQTAAEQVHHQYMHDHMLEADHPHGVLAEIRELQGRIDRYEAAARLPSTKGND